MKKSRKIFKNIMIGLSSFGALALPTGLVIKYDTSLTPLMNDFTQQANDITDKVNNLIGPITEKSWFWPVIVIGIVLLILIMIFSIISVKRKIKKEKQRKEQLLARQAQQQLAYNDVNTHSQPPKRPASRK